MRYDDMLATVLARQPNWPTARISQWRQIFDLLAQRRLGADPTVGHDALARLENLRADVPVTIRRETARSLAGRPVPLRLVAFLAEDVPQVAGEILGHVRLSEDEWLRILPRLSPTGRGIVRHRRDLSRPVIAALAGFGNGDFALGAEPGPQLPSITPMPAALPVEEAATASEPVVQAKQEGEITSPIADGAGASEPTSEHDPVPIVDEAVEPDALPAFEPEAQPALQAESMEEPEIDPEPEPEPEPASGRESEPNAASLLALQPEPQPIPDLAPPIAIEPAPYEPGAGEGQIRAIISRIARFRNGQEIAPLLQVQRDEEQDVFHFETGPDGIIRWVEGVARGAIVGETIAVPAAGNYGVDAQAPGAFRRRAAFRDARLVVAGTGSAAGEWRMAGVPIFAPADGRFLGYRGTARRPRPDERAEALATPPIAAPEDAGNAALSADSLRQLVHELRTPLNAIGGFAEMIRRQMRGPVSEAYRGRAQRIAEQASQLLAAVDDLDVAARLDGAQLDLQRVPVDVALLLSAVCADHADLVRARGSAIVREVAADLPSAIGDATAMRRMIARLLSSATALADAGEPIHATLAASGGHLALAVTRPRKLAGVSEAELLDPGYGPDGDWPDAPLLGLGFSLHLVRRLAAAAEGALLIEDASFILCLPTAEIEQGAAADL